MEMAGFDRINFRIGKKELPKFTELVLRVRERAGYEVPLAAIAKGLMGLRQIDAIKPEDRAFLRGESAEDSQHGTGHPPYRSRRRG